MDNVFEEKELQWAFDDKGPFVRVGRVGDWKTTLYVDPTPCFTHDLELVKTTLALCESSFPLPKPVSLYVISFEGTGRTNGQTHHESDYKEKSEHDEYITYPLIALFGKRTPIHPAMTRYLVAHEYGHAVDRAIASKRYAGGDPCSALHKDYAKMRGLPEISSYGPTTWHLATTEVIANDFRVLVMGIEKEFWAHPVPMPSEVPEVVAWWEEVRKQDLTTKLPPKAELKDGPKAV